MHGQGSFFFGESGKEYNGEFTNNNITGTGTMTWPDGMQYEGQFLNGKMDGRGTKTWPNGNTYDGMFRNNLQHGPGEHWTSATGELKKQEWRVGKEWHFAKQGQQEIKT